ncbi:MAG: hypothetical protein Q8P07_02245 [bacterium]|nr:hypothetical protein [bacterium]
MRALKNLVLIVAVLFAQTAIAGEIRLILKSHDSDISDKVLFETPDCDFSKLAKALEPFSAVKQTGRDNITWYSLKSEVLEANKKNGYVNVDVSGCTLEHAQKNVSRGAEYIHTFYGFSFPFPQDAKAHLYDSSWKEVGSLYGQVEIFTYALSPRSVFEELFVTWVPVSLQGYIRVLPISYEFPATADKITGFKIMLEPRFINGTMVTPPPPPPLSPIR